MKIILELHRWRYCDSDLLFECFRQDRTGTSHRQKTDTFLPKGSKMWHREEQEQMMNPNLMNICIYLATHRYKFKTTVRTRNMNNCNNE